MVSGLASHDVKSSELASARVRLDDAKFLYFSVGAILCSLVVPPVVMLIKTSLTVSDITSNEVLGFGNYLSILRSPGSAVLFWNTLVFAGGTSVVGILLGTGLAWLVERTNAPLKKAAYVSAFAALAVPNVIWTIGWIFLLNSRNGLFNVWLMELFHLSSGPFDVFTMQGMILVDGLQVAPMAFLLMAVPLRAMDPSLEEVAAMCGASPRQLFLRITLRLSSPACLAVMLLIFVRAVEAFEIPALLGLPGGVHVLTTEIYQRVHSGAFPDYGLGSAYSVLLVAIASTGIYGYGRVTREARRFAVVTGKGYVPRIRDLGRWRFVAALAVMTIPAIIAMPLALIAWASLQPFYRLPSATALKALTLDNYVSVLERKEITSAVFNSIVTAGLAATTSLLLTTAVAWLVLRTRLPRVSLLDQTVSLTLAMPGVVLGLAILKTYLTVPLPIYGTIWILVIAHVTRALPFAMRYAHAGLAQIHPEIEESGQISGATGPVVFRRIVLPLLMPALFGGWVWVFLTAIRELPMTLILVGPSSQMLSSVIFDLWSGGQLLDMAAFSVMVTACLVSLAFVLWRISERIGVHF